MMSLNRHSIFLKLNVLFLIALLSITAVFFTFSFISKKRQVGIVFSDVKQVMRIIRTADRFDNTQLPSMLDEAGFTLISEKEQILQLAKPIKRPPKHLSPRLSKRLHDKLTVLYHDRDYYYSLKLRSGEFLIKAKVQEEKQPWILLSYITVIAILLFIYFTLRRALKPIKNLEIEIEKFGEGNLDIHTKSDKKDEIAAVANQFHNAVEKINRLQDTRTLFLRNIMHELKTPITKGKLSLSLMEENSEKAMLGRVFERLESLIHEMAEIEQITSHNVSLQRSDYPLEEIVNQAKKLLYVEDENVLTDKAPTIINCDLSLFTIVMKNLIDNGVKYSEDATVHISSDAHSIRITNHGAPLQEEFAHYLEPFYKGALNPTNQKGFGLGLYIVSEIVTMHGYTLSYAHREGENIFTITL